MNKKIYLTLICVSILITTFAQTNTTDYAALKTELEKIYDIDQGMRKKLEKISTGKKQGHPEVKAYWEKIHKADDENLEKIEEIIAKYGWLSASKVGKKASDTQFLVIQHSNPETRKKYLPLLKKMAKKGEISKLKTALMEDRVMMFSGKKQVYGSQAMIINNRSFIWPIEDVKNVNKRRKEAGFTMTIAAYAKKFNFEFNPNEPLPKMRIKPKKKKKK